MRFRISGSERVGPLFVGAPSSVQVMQCFTFFRYWEDEQQTKTVMHRDVEDDSTLWMYTGDEGIMDEEGYLKSKSNPSIDRLSTDLIFVTVVGRIKVNTLH